ncbi:MAG: hypothetical protein J7498_11165 [Sphingobium sp.]|nr:hypothetical protein [Sphingobium sp.]
MSAAMLYQPIPADIGAGDLAEELCRARRIFLALNDPSDLQILETYIAELEARQHVMGQVAGFAS